MRYVGERSSGSPGVSLCHHPVTGQYFLLPPLSVTQYDLRTVCALNGPSDLGMLIVRVAPQSAVSRISARARVDVLGPTPGPVGIPSQTFFVDGLPLASLDTTETVHVASGLSELPTTAAGVSRRVDCFFGTLYDGSGNGGVLGRVTLKDKDGMQLGSDVWFAQHPLELQRFTDVFKLAGAPAGAQDGVRAEFYLGGGGDAVLAYCWMDQHAANKAGNYHTVVMAMAQVVDPQEETRRRSIVAESTPRVQPAGATFVLNPKEKGVVHGLFVRHPDRVSCRVGAKDALRITATAPDGTQAASGTTGQTIEFATVPHGQTNFGVNGLWGLEIEWDPSAAKKVPVSYVIDCRSGNGTSLADEMFRN
jgi:hypothetical protein